MATIKHIFKGESLSMLFAFPAEYDMERIQSHGIWIGGTEFTGVIIGQGIELKLTSIQTDLMSGNQRVSLWIDDTILGVRKPYVGDIAVGNTNALPDNESTSEVYDVIVNVDISVTSIEAGDLMFNYVKGDKGDPITYDDLTPEQIAELQQPATDAIASIQEVELAVETAEGLRVQAELNRQTNTSTAISNAEQATDDANDAALLANEKALLANEKALLANEKAGLAATATTQANDARDGANSAAQSATNLVNSYATDLAQKASHGYSSNPKTLKQVEDLIETRGENLVVDFTEIRREIHISSIDYDTGIFTASAPHSLTNSMRVIAILNDGSDFFLSKYIPSGLTLIASTAYVEVVDSMRFKIPSNTISDSNSDVDLTKWHFEVISGTANYNFTNLSGRVFRLEIIGRDFFSFTYLEVQSDKANTDSYVSQIAFEASGNQALGRSRFLLDNGNIYTKHESIIDGRNGLSIKQKLFSIKSILNNKTQVATTVKESFIIPNFNSGVNQINTISLYNGYGFANGTKVLIYKLQ